MAKSDEIFDEQAAHRAFSGRCFNLAWELIDNLSRTEEDNDRMLMLAQTSLWHWLQRDDRRDHNLSVGYWQLSRVHALRGDAGAARLQGQRALEKGAGDPFCVGYAYEALARAERLAGNSDRAAELITRAREQAELISKLEDKQLLVTDLEAVAALPDRARDS